MATLHVEHGEGAPYEVELRESELKIGRGSTNDLAFSDRWLSRHHARVLRREGTYYVEDLGSRNGTFVNGFRLTESRPLRAGDRITLGDIELVFAADGVARQLSRSDSPLPMSSTVVLGSESISLDRFREESWGKDDVDRDEARLFPILNAAASALISHYPLEELVEVILEVVAEAVPSERSALLLREGDEGRDLQVKAVRGFAEDDAVHISSTLIREVLDKRHAVLTMDAKTDDRFDGADSILLQGITSIVCAPLWNNRDVIGLVYLDNRLSTRTFDQRDLRLTGLVANMAAVKIENAMLLEEQIERKRMAEQLALGAQIQRGLLPSKNPEIPGYDICGMNESCYEVGGDYYDFVPRADGRLAVVIADISGKGVAAALLMAVLQASLRTLTSTQLEPAALVDRLNQVLVENSPANKFATLFYAELDPESHSIVFVNGGHNPGLLAFPDGTVEELGSTGPLVGLIPGMTYESRRVDMPPGARLFLYTDGINELTDAHDEEFGTEPLVELLNERPPMDGHALLSAVRERMAAWNDSPGGEDDTTMVVVRRLGEDALAEIEASREGTVEVGLD